jgi:hypothetical protein
MTSTEKFWMFDVSQLFQSFDIFPSPDDTLVKKLNTITRLALVVCVVIAVFNPIVALSTLILVIVVTTSVFSVSMADPTKEGFEEKEESKFQEKKLLHQFMGEYHSTRHPDLTTFGFPLTRKRFCNDEVPLEFGPDYVSLNQSLVGGPNPKTKIPPLIAAPSHDLESWKNNDFVVHSHINRETNFDEEKSGYSYGMQMIPFKSYKPCSEPEEDIMETFKDLGKDIENPKPKHPRMRRGNQSVEPIEDDDEKNEMIDIPPPPPCFESARRDNLITQTLQPGIFQKSHIGEPIQSNIGISFTQQFGPTKITEKENKIKFTTFDPESVTVIPDMIEERVKQDHSNIYDPRFTGYGTSYRGYTDKLTGQPKFFYDDVDSITMPNYITRSKVDIFPWAKTYGPDDMISDVSDGRHRKLANDAFTNSALKFRTELQERLMRKRNAELWQRRVAPITTMGSSMRSCL